MLSHIATLFASIIVVVIAAVLRIKTGDAGFFALAAPIAVLAFIFSAFCIRKEIFK